MRQPDGIMGCPDTWLNFIFWCVSGGISQMKVASGSVDSVNQFTTVPLNVGEHHSIYWDLNKNSKMKEGRLSPCLPFRLSWDAHHLLSLVLLILRPSDPEWNLHHHCPGFPGPWTNQLPWVSNLHMQVVELVGLHNCISQFFTINPLKYTFLYIFRISY